MKKETKHVKLLNKDLESTRGLQDRVLESTKEKWTKSIFFINPKIELSWGLQYV